MTAELKLILETDLALLEESTMFVLSLMTHLNLRVKVGCRWKWARSNEWALDNANEENAVYTLWNEYGFDFVTCLSQHPFDVSTIHDRIATFDDLWKP